MIPKSFPGVAEPLLLAAAAGVAWAASRRDRGRERHAWARLAAAYGLFTAAAVAVLLPLAPTPRVLLAAALGVAGFLSFLLGIELRPELPRTAALREQDPFDAWGALLVLVAFFAYFVYAPAIASPEELVGRWPGTLLRGCLDLLLLWRALSLAAAAGPHRWRSVRLWLALDLAARGIAQLVGAGGGRGWLVVGLGGVGLAAVAAAAFAASAGSRRPLEGRPALLGNEAGTSASLVVAATLALPLVHLLVRPFVLRFPETYPLREAVVVAFVAASGSLAILQLRRRQRLRDDAERRLAASERRFRHLVDRSTDAVLLERGGRIEFANGAARRLFALPEETGPWSLGRLGVGPPAGSADLPSRRRETLEAGGETRRLDLAWRRLELEGGDLGWLAVARDVTALEREREGELRLGRLAELGGLAATIAEEMRAPVDTLTRECEVLAVRLAAPGDDDQTAADLRLATERIRRIVDGLADRAGAAAPRRVEVDLVELLEEAVREAEPALAAAGLRVRRRYAREPARVRADRDAIAQVFANVLANAAVASRAGSEIELGSAISGDRVEVEVVDHGSGISAQDLERVYEPFFTTRPDGTGLGLAIVARILAENGAEHAISSEVGKGTRFRVSFPAASATSEGREPGRA